jgi:hypothetical protein
MPRRPARCAAARVGRGQARLGVGVDEQPARAGVAQHRGQGLGGGRGRQRRHRHAGAQRAHEQRGVAHRRAGADGDALAGLNAILLQHGGDAVHQRVELGVAERVVIGAQGGVAGALARVLGDQVGQGERGRRVRGGHGVRRVVGAAR